jgi:hypothetical protein
LNRYSFVRRRDLVHDLMPQVLRLAAAILH